MCVPCLRTVYRKCMQPFLLQCEGNAVYLITSSKVVCLGAHAPSLKLNTTERKQHVFRHFPHVYRIYFCVVGILSPPPRPTLLLGPLACGVVSKGLLTFLGSLYKEVAKTTSGTLVYRFEKQTARKERLLPSKNIVSST